MNQIFLEITVVIVVASVLGFVARLLKQPTILGYIVTGLIIGPLGLLHLDNPGAFDTLAQIGITFLLFLVGMEMRFKDLRRIGKTALLAGGGQIVFATVLGYGLCRLMGFAPAPSFFIAAALMFSSTIIVVKLLSEKRALESLYGKIVVGILLAQDLVALLMIMVLSSLGAAETGGFSLDALAPIGFTLLKGCLLFAAAMLVGRFLLPRVMHIAGRSGETLFLISLAWGMGLAAFAALPQVGLTIEMGGFLAGLAISDSLEHSQVASRIRSIRDFFLVMFFVVLGSKMLFSNLSAIWLPTAALSLFVLIGNPAIVILVMSALGYRSRTSFMSGVAVAQISEFSLILVLLAQRLGYVDDRVVSLVTAVGLVTITASSYLILHSEKIYLMLRRTLKRLEFNVRDLEIPAAGPPLSGHIVLVGCDRMGHGILHSIEGLHKRFLVIDFNPDIVQRLQSKGVRAIYGDISDPDIREEAALDEARLVISTVPALGDSQSLLRHLRETNRKAKVILTAENELDALKLYEEGADYVLLPHFIGGLQLAKTIHEDSTLRTLKKMRLRDLNSITGGR